LAETLPERAPAAPPVVRLQRRPPHPISEAVADCRRERL